MDGKDFHSPCIKPSMKTVCQVSPFRFINKDALQHSYNMLSYDNFNDIESEAEQQ